MNEFHQLGEERIYCPYCGEPLDVLIDASEGSQTYIEDCQVCCRPIEFFLTLDMEGNSHLSVQRDDE